MLVQNKLSELPIVKRNKLIIDSTMIRNLDGIDKTGRIYNDRFRKGNKLTLICTEDKIPCSIVVSEANIHDLEHVSPALGAIPNLPKRVRLLADKGYISEALRSELADLTNVSLIYPQRSNSTTKTTVYHKGLLKKRCRVEHVFGELSKYKSIRERSNKSFEHFKDTCQFIVNNLICNKLGL